LRDYAAGAFEALSWVKTLIRESKERCRTCQKILEEINYALEEMQAGVAVDFRERLAVNW